MNKVYTTLLAGSLLVGVAGASDAATFSYNFFESDGIPLAYNYAHVSGTTYALTGSTSEIDLVFAGNTPLGALSVGTHYSVTLSVSLVESSGDLANPLQQQTIDSITETFVGNAGPFAGMTLLKLTAGSPPIPDRAGVLNAPNGQNTGGFNGSNTAATFGAPVFGTVDNVVYTSDFFSTAGWTFQGYSDAIQLAPGKSFSYTPRPGLFQPDDLDPFTASLQGGGQATTPVPEPGSIALATGGLISFMALRLRRRK
jgi:hypothetical protein